MASNFSKPSFSTTLSFWDSSTVKTMVGGILMGYTSWVDWKYIACWDSGGALFPPKFYRMKGDAGINANWVVTTGCTDVTFLDLDLKAYSSRLVSLIAYSLRLYISFWCWASNWVVSSFSICLLLKRVLYMQLNRGLYVNLLNENHTIIQSKYKMLKLMMLSRRKMHIKCGLAIMGWQQSLFMGFRNLMPLSYQWGDPCLVLPKLELLIALRLSIQDNSFCQL
jgi:hypothetical protein